MRLLALLVSAALLSGCLGTQNRPLQLVSGAGPTYPADARSAGIEGEVVVRYDVSAEGQVVNARVESAEPAGVFDQAALATVRSWKFKAQVRDGEPQRVENLVSRVRFRLDDQDVYDGY